MNKLKLLDGCTSEAWGYERVVLELAVDHWYSELVLEYTIPILELTPAQETLHEVINCNIHIAHELPPFSAKYTCTHNQLQRPSRPRPWVQWCTGELAGGGRGFPLCLTLFLSYGP